MFRDIFKDIDTVAEHDDLDNKDENKDIDTVAEHDDLDNKDETNEIISELVGQFKILSDIVKEMQNKINEKESVENDT